jgi:tetratricopeptide (TPR) repeat protein
MAAPPEPRSSGLAPTPEPAPALMNRSDYRLVRSLLTLQRQRATGTLRVEAEGILTVTRFRDGHPALVEGGLPADSLGRLLVQRGRISESTLAKIEEQRMVMQGRLRFGEVATRLGVLEYEVLALALRDQVRDKLGRCLHWERSQHAFVSEEHDAEPFEGAPLDIEPLLLAGIARHYSAERVQDVLSPVWQEKVELRGQARHVAARFAFDPDDQRMFEQLLGATSVGQLLTGPARKNPRFGHLLVALALTDQLKMPELELPEESGPFIIDELPREARNDGQRDSGPIPVVNFELLRRSQPPIPPASNLPGKDKLLADSAFLQGKELLRAGEYGAAADAFREAANLRPGALEYTLFAAWSAYLSAGRDKKWRDMLVELCDKALAQDRHLAFAHHVKGRLALEKQDQATAKQCLERALELDPHDDEAKRLLDRMRS